MARDHYDVFFPTMEDGDEVVAMGVEVYDGGSLVVCFELPRSASFAEMMQLRRAIVDEKPPTLVREIAAGWVQQLSIRRERDR